MVPFPKLNHPHADLKLNHATHLEDCQRHMELGSAGYEESPPAVVLGGIRIGVDIEGGIAVRIADAAGHLDDGRL